MPVCREEAVKRYYKLVRLEASNIAKRSKGLASPDEYEDLFQEGMLALIGAADRATCWCTSYFRRSIRGAMQHWIRDKVRLIQIPAWYQEQINPPPSPLAILHCDLFNTTRMKILEEDTDD